MTGSPAAFYLYDVPDTDLCLYKKSYVEHVPH